MTSPVHLQSVRSPSPLVSVWLAADCKVPEGAGWPQRPILWDSCSDSGLGSHCLWHARALCGCSDALKPDRLTRPRSCQQAFRPRTGVLTHPSPSRCPCGVLPPAPGNLRALPCLLWLPSACVCIGLRSIHGRLLQFSEPPFSGVQCVLFLRSLIQVIVF